MKTGRNDPCPCGSGNKYKKCCLDKDQAAKLAASKAAAAPAGDTNPTGGRPDAPEIRGERQDRPSGGKIAPKAGPPPPPARRRTV